MCQKPLSSLWKMARFFAALPLVLTVTRWVKSSNTAMTGYQEILTDPSYARQIVTLTYPYTVTPESQQRMRSLGPFMPRAW